MRVIIQPDYQSVSKWAAHYVAAKIKAANPTPEKPFVLGCPTGSSPLGMYKELIDLNKKGMISFQNELKLIQKCQLISFSKSSNPITSEKMIGKKKLSQSLTLKTKLSFVKIKNDFMDQIIVFERRKRRDQKNNSQNRNQRK